MCRSRDDVETIVVSCPNGHNVLKVRAGDTAECASCGATMSVEDSDSFDYYTSDKPLAEYLSRLGKSP